MKVHYAEQVQILNQEYKVTQIEKQFPPSNSSAISRLEFRVEHLQIPVHAPIEVSNISAGKMFACFNVKRYEDNQTFFLKNGGRLLEELITFCNGKSNPIRHFSAKELLIATNNYDPRQIFVEDFGYQLYKGSLNDRLIFVKKYGYLWGSEDNAYKDIAIGSQMSVHKNVLKVTGCCLETEIPTTVYEFAGTKILSTCISTTNVEPLRWKCRLKIAIGIANAIAYLHNAFSRPVIHRDINCSNIILDQNNVPKLIDFGLSVSIPEGKSDIEDPLTRRTLDVAPEYCVRGYITEKVDVFQFGLLLIELLSGYQTVLYTATRCSDQKHVEMLVNGVDSRIKNEGIDMKQLQDFATLILRCTSYDEEQRPTMIEVAKELRRIDQSFPSPC
ncbi:hypothetical protein SCA6_003175 [Theobroma cacao]